MKHSPKHCVFLCLVFILIAPSQLLASSGDEKNKIMELIEKLDSDDSILNASRRNHYSVLTDGMNNVELNSLIAGDEGFLGSKLDTKWKKEEFGATLVKSQQRYNGLEVFGGEVVVRTDKNSINQMGFLFKDIKVEKNPKISKDQAIALIKEKFGDESIIDGKLGISPEKSGARLAYRFTVTKSIYESYAVYLDGMTGKILRAFSLVDSFNPASALQGVDDIPLDPDLMNILGAAEDRCGGQGKKAEKKLNIKPLKGSGIDLAGKRVSFSVVPFKDGRFALWNTKKNNIIFDAKSKDIFIKKDGPKKQNKATWVFSADKENWGDESKAAISAHHHAEIFIDFLNDKLKRKFLNHENEKIKSFVNMVRILKDGKKMVDGAFFVTSQNIMMYYAGSWNAETKTGNFKNWAGALDLAAHEMAHGITANTSCLEYLNESGAINESFSDMMGTAVEYYYDRENFNWGMAEELVTPTTKALKGGFRLMDNPQKRGQPDTYKGKNWYSGKGDYGGIHHNSGVGNKAFYLMVEGGNHNGVTVPGLGMDKAVLIAYRANQNYLTKKSQYIDCAKSFVLAAKDLYGNEDAGKVLLAWKAVKLEVNDQIIRTPKKAAPAPQKKSPKVAEEKKSAPAPAPAPSEKKPDKPTEPDSVRKKEPEDNSLSEEGFLGDL